MLVKNIEKYDGKLLHNRFAYSFYRQSCSPLGNIIAFRAPMEVLAEGMIDKEDLIKKAFIWSDDAINFLWELPVLGNNCFGAVAYQRLFNTLISEILSQPEFLNLPIKMDGDDIMVQYQKHSIKQWGKCSVSITHVKNGAALGHTGINISAGQNAPKFAYSTLLTNSQVNDFSKKVIDAFSQLNQDIFIATAKIVS